MTTTTTHRDVKDSGPPLRGGGRRPGATPPPVRALLRGSPLAPAVILLVLFLAGPIAYCIYYAFTDLQLTGAAATHFVGLDNFVRAFSDSGFLNAVWLTLVFTVGSAIIGQNTLGLSLAVLMEQATAPVRAITSTVVVGAWVLPEVVAGYLMYAFFFDKGSLNAILGGLGLPQQNWLYTLPILAVCLANVWRGTAFSMMVFSAALNEVPQELVEAATVDGAGPWKRLWHVTLPIIRRSIMSNLMLITLQTLSVFGLIYIMTGGGPGNSTQTLSFLNYQTFIINTDFGLGGAMSILLVLLALAVSFVYVRAFRPSTN